MKKAGFTLVETMVVVVIMVIIFGIVVAYLNVWRISQAIQESATKVQEDARRAINFMCRELRSTYIDSSLADGNWKDENDVNWSDEIEFKIPVYDDNDGMYLNIAKPGEPSDMIYIETVVDGSGNVDKGAYLRGEDPSVFDGSSEDLRTQRSIKYLLENNKIKRRLFDSVGNAISGEDTVLANNVQFLGFMEKSDADPRIIIIRVRVRKRTFPWKATPETEFSLTGRAALRN